MKVVLDASAALAALVGQEKALVERIIEGATDVSSPTMRIPLADA